MIGAGATTWGSTPDERALRYPCDELIAGRAAAWFRAVDVAAPAPVAFRWLCQLRVAPYSYDWIDNLGRRSPRVLTPGLDDLAVGQRFMIGFRLVSFERDRHVTVEARPRVGPDVVMSYVVTPADADRSRLVLKMLIGGPPGLLAVFAAGELVMARKQLRTLAALAASPSEQI